MFRFLIFGEGDVPPVTHEVLRHSIADAAAAAVRASDLNGKSTAQ
jgi:hypothetical protein